MNRRQRGVASRRLSTSWGSRTIARRPGEDAFGLVANRSPNGSTGPWRASTRCSASAGTTTSGRSEGGWGGSAKAGSTTLPSLVGPVHPCVPPQAATPVDAGAAPAVPTRPLQLEASGAHDLNPLATSFNPPPMAGPAVCRQAPEVGAGWFSDHVRICAGGAQQCAFLPRVCRACPTAWRWKSFIQPDGGEGLVKRKGCRREAGSEGSVEQSRDPTNRNRIRGLPGRTSGLATAKSSAIKDRGGRSGGCAVKAVELTSGDLRRVPASGTEGTARCPDRGAEVSRGHSRPGDRPKARTVPARG